MREKEAGLLWIPPTTRYASELQSFIENKSTELSLRNLINFSYSPSYAYTTQDETVKPVFDVCWSERTDTVLCPGEKHELITGCDFTSEFSEWDIPWLTGCTEDETGRPLAVSLDHLPEAFPTSKQQEDNMHLLQAGLSKLEIDTNTHEDYKLEFSDIDSAVETFLSDASDSYSIKRIEYRSKTKATKKSQWTWAIQVPLSFPENPVLNPILTFPFELDPFQKHSISHLEQGHSIFVSAHTSAGKTLVAEYAAALALSKLTRVIYTSPIKALSNQKYYEFSQRFSQDHKDTSTPKKETNFNSDEKNATKSGSGDAPFCYGNLSCCVGLLTGDMQVNPHASLLVMTTEILRSMLYKNSSLLADLTCVIFDEVHYMNDSERGVVWEETLILLPPSIQLVLLSATLPNAMELADWLGRTRGEPIWVITTPHRPVPLEHYLLPVPSNAQTKPIPLLLSDKPHVNTVFPSQKSQSANAAKPVQKTHRGTSTAAAPTKKLTTTNLRPQYTPYTKRVTHFISSHIKGVLKFIQSSNLLPAIVFIFSRKRCEEVLNVLSTSTTSLLSKEEQYFLSKFINTRVLPLLEANGGRPLTDDCDALSDRQSKRQIDIPQVLATLEMLRLGIATHHSGLLPILKETIELLFSNGVIKVLIATETFAMGINMPAKCVIFGELEKPDVSLSLQAKRLITPGEYTQMAGRAGRRGIDNKGIVFICHAQDESTDDQEKMIKKVKELIRGKGEPLQSQFRLTYNTILQLIRKGSTKGISSAFLSNADCTFRPPSNVHTTRNSLHGNVFDISDLLRKSFFENATQRNLPSQVAALEQAEIELEDLEIPECPSGCDEFSMLELRTFISEHLASQDDAAFTIGRRVISVAENTEFLQPGIIVGSIGSKEASDSLFQILLFPSLNLFLSEDSLERLIDPSASNSTLTIQTVPKSALLAIPGKLILPPGNGLAFSSSDWHFLHHSMLECQATDGRSTDSTVCPFNIPILACPQLSSHWQAFTNLAKCQQKINTLRWNLSGESLSLIPEYRSRLRVLEVCNFIQIIKESSATITLKGRIACEIQTADELLVTELLVERVWSADLPAEDLVSLLSVFVFQEQAEEEQDQKNVPPHLQPYVKKMRSIAKHLAGIQQESGLPQAVAIIGHDRINTGLVGVIHAWASGCSFGEICKMTEIQAGIIVRTVLRLDETCRDVRNAARIMGDYSLQEKMLQASQMIKRDICYLKSLYLD